MTFNTFLDEKDGFYLILLSEVIAAHSFVSEFVRIQITERGK